MDKRKFEQYKRIMRLFGVAILGCGTTAMFLRVWTQHYNEDIVFPFYSKGHWLMGAFYIFFFFIFVHIYGGLSYGYLKNSEIVFSQSLALVCANAAIYLEIVLLSARFVDIVPIAVMTAVQFLIVLVWSSIWSRLFYLMFPPHKLTVLYQSYDPEQMLQKVGTRRDRYRVEKTVNVDMPWEELKEVIDSCEAVLIYDVHAALRNKILKYCYEKSIRVYTTPKISDVLVKSAENIHLFDTPLMLLRNNGLSFEQRLIKRVMDIVISLVVIVISSPIMLIIALCIKLHDGGPVFFTQKRCTKDGKIFTIHKFRSMIVDAEKDEISIPASEKDPRITPIGNIIRATRLDELPQAFDILIGNMSVVGPRPERIEHVQKYTKEIPEFAYRLKVKGGLTGYAQVYGKYNTSAYDKLKLDLMYVQNYSVLLDLKLILMTLKIIFIKGSTEGFDEKQISELQSRDL